MRLELHGDLHIHMHSKPDTATTELLEKILHNVLINQTNLQKMDAELISLKQQLLDQATQIDGYSTKLTDLGNNLTGIDGDLKSLNDKIAALQTPPNSEGNIVISAADLADLKATADATSSKISAFATQLGTVASQAAAIDAETAGQ